METSNRPVPGTSRKGSLTPVYSNVPAAIDPELVEAFRALTDRERTIGRLLDQTRSRRELPPYESHDLLIKICDWSGPLRDVPEWALDECFTRAMQQHDYRQVFQSCEVAEAWRRMDADDRRKLYNITHDLEPGEIPLCEWCDGHGFKRVTVVSPNECVDVPWNSKEFTNAMARCHCRKP